MSDDLTVLGVDGIRRSFDEHYDTMMEVEQDPTGAYIAIQNQHARIEELEAKLAKAVAGLKQCEEEIDQYIWQEYPSDHPVHERYRKRDFSANPARLALAALSSVSCANLKGQDDE